MRYATAGGSHSRRSGPNWTAPEAGLDLARPLSRRPRTARCLATAHASSAELQSVLDAAAEDLSAAAAPMRSAWSPTSPTPKRPNGFSTSWASGGTASSTCSSTRRAQRGRHLRRPHRRPVAAGRRRGRDGHGALRPVGTAAAAQGGVGADRQLLGALDAAAERHPARLHGGQGDGHEHLQEPVAGAGPGRDHGERRLAGQHRCRSRWRAGPNRSASTEAIPTR